jgi:Protein of unknown function (DUF2924)
MDNQLNGESSALGDAAATAAIESEIEKIQPLNPSEVRALWRDTFKKDVPKANALLAAELKVLGGLGTDVLRQRWTVLFGMAPSPRISRELLVRAVAHRIQEEAHGGVGKSYRRRLARLGETLREGGSLEVTQTRTFKPGTKLIREWKGKVHEVVIAGGTYIWAGQQYRSLSQIARAITGTRWSGPRFFGLEAGQQAADG